MVEYQAAYWKVNKLTIPLHNSNLVILCQAGVASWGTDEGKFIRIFTQRSRPQLAATFPEYKAVSFKLRTTLNSRREWGNLDGGKCNQFEINFSAFRVHASALRLAQSNSCSLAVCQLTKKDIAESIDSEMDGDLQKAFLTLGKYPSERLPTSSSHCMKGVCTDHEEKS